jgi:hypothetical protein
MPGGLMQLVKSGEKDIILNGNPSKSFFKAAYSKYTNFSTQRFRVDFEGTRTLRMNEESTMDFKIPRYGDLLMDSYVSVNLPNIWSPIMPPETTNPDSSLNTGSWIPYEFKWIDYLGATMISNISIRCGNFTIQEYSGEYLLSMVQRDFPQDKKEVFYKMIGHTPENNNPGSSGARVNVYPNAFVSDSVNGSEPSIRGGQILIPLNAWFCLQTQQSVPLVSLQYNELHIHITFRPVQQLFKIRDVLDSENNYPYIAPNFNQWYMQFHRFLQTPPDTLLTSDSYQDKRTQWNADIHLMCTYGFLSKDEQRIFAQKEQKYLIKQVKETTYKNVSGTKKIDLESQNLVSGYMFALKRNDIHMRNEWTNRTNWPYSYIPYDITPAPSTSLSVPSPTLHPILRTHPNGIIEELYIAPGVNVNGNSTGWYLTGDFKLENTKTILETVGVLFDGHYRENILPAIVYNYIEKYSRTNGRIEDGLYYYNFSLKDTPFSIHPSGAANMAMHNLIELETVTITPPLDPNAQTLSICDPLTGEIVAVNKPTWRIYDYNYDLTLFEDRYNILHFASGNCGLAYAT